jgi:hypothetical protein
MSITFNDGGIKSTTYIDSENIRNTYKIDLAFPSEYVSHIVMSPRMGMVITSAYGKELATLMGISRVRIIKIHIYWIVT